MTKYIVIQTNSGLGQLPKVWSETSTNFNTIVEKIVNYVKSEDLLFGESENKIVQQLLESNYVILGDEELSFVIQEFIELPIN